MNDKHNETHESHFLTDYLRGVGMGFTDTIKLMLFFLSGIWLLGLILLPFWLLWSALKAVISALQARSVSSP